MRARPEPDVVTAPVEEILEAIEAVDLGAPWEQVAPQLRPALPRRRAMPPGTEDIPRRDYPPGITVTLGMDIGPAMLFVADEQLASWGVSADHAFDQALENIRDRVTARKQFALIHERIADVPTIAFQSRDGWASALLLLPDQLARVLGNRDGLIIAPMRDVIISIPLEADPGVAIFILEEFAALDMNALDLPLFALVDGELFQAVAIPESAEVGPITH